MGPCGLGLNTANLDTEAFPSVAILGSSDGQVWRALVGMASFLRAMKPTADEIEAAHKILKSSGDKGEQKRQLKAAGVNMKSWAQRCGEISAEDREVLDNSRGDARQELALLYHVYQLRLKKGNQKTETYNDDKTEDMTKNHEWREEEMDKILGENAGKLLRDSGKLDTKACSITNSWDRYLKLWVVPKHVVKSMKVSGTAVKIEAEKEAGVEDLVALKMLKNGVLQNSAEKVAKTEEEEPKTEEELRQSGCDELAKNPSAFMRKIVDIELEEAGWLTKAKLMPLAKILQGHLEDHEAVLKKTKALLHKLVKGDKLKEGGVAATYLLIKQIESQHAENRRGAGTFSIIAKGSKKRKGEFNTLVAAV